MKTGRAIALLLLLPAAIHLQAQQLSVDQLVASSLERSVSLNQAELRQRLSELGRDTVFSAASPSITVSADPLYGFSRIRVPDTSVLPPTNADRQSNSTGIGLLARQLLPTGGVLAGSAGATFSATISDPDGSADTTYELSPSISLSLSQPLFVDGSIIDVDQFFLNRDNATLSVASAASGTATVREQLVLSVVRLTTQRNALRRAVQAQQVRQQLIQLRLDEARIREQQGQGSRQEMVSLQVQLNQLRDAELQSRLGARELELELSRLSGVTIDEETVIDVPDGTGVDLPDSNDGSLAMPISIEQAERELQTAEIGYQLARKQSGATADLFLSLTPRYADDRENPGTLAGAFTDFSGAGSGVDINAGIALSIPLTEGGARRRLVEQAAVSLEIARESLTQAERELAAVRELVAIRVDTLRQRIALLEFDLRFEREQLESDLELRELGAVTPFQIAQREGSITQAEIDLRNLESELYVQILETLRAGGADIVPFVTGDSTGVE